MIIATDTETDKQYKIGIHGPMRANVPVLMCGPGVWTPTYCQNEERHPLTPLPDDHVEVLYRRLGKAVYESVPDKAKSRVTGEFRTCQANESHVERGCVYENLYEHNSVVILASKAPPPPPTRTITIPGLCEDAEMSEETYQNIKQQLGKD